MSKLYDSSSEGVKLWTCLSSLTAEVQGQFPAFAHNTSQTGKLFPTTKCSCNGTSKPMSYFDCSIRFNYRCNIKLELAYIMCICVCLCCLELAVAVGFGRRIEISRNHKKISSVYSYTTYVYEKSASLNCFFDDSFHRVRFPAGLIDQS